MPSRSASQKLGWLELSTDSDGPVSLDPSSIACICGGGPGLELYLDSGKMLRLLPVEENQREALLQRIAEAKGV